eukprot:COSAG06_NODE_3335_length_5489_cov_72.469202_2_plen_66_part_00
MDIDRRGKLATTDAIDATDAAAVTTRRDIDMTFHDDFIRNPRKHACQCQCLSRASKSDVICQGHS